MFHTSVCQSNLLRYIGPSDDLPRLIVCRTFVRKCPFLRQSKSIWVCKCVLYAFYFFLSFFVSFFQCLLHVKLGCRLFFFCLGLLNFGERNVCALRWGIDKTLMHIEREIRRNRIHLHHQSKYICSNVFVRRE